MKNALSPKSLFKAHRMTRKLQKHLTQLESDIKGQWSNQEEAKGFLESIQEDSLSLTLLQEMYVDLLDKTGAIKLKTVKF